MYFINFLGLIRAKTTTIFSVLSSFASIIMLKRFFANYTKSGFHKPIISWNVTCNVTRL
jgi:hypothetical protein